MLFSALQASSSRRLAAANFTYAELGYPSLTVVRNVVEYNSWPRAPQNSIQFVCKIWSCAVLKISQRYSIQYLHKASVQRRSLRLTTHTDLEDDGNRSRRSELKGSTCSSRQQPSADHSITYILEVASNSDLSPLLAKYPPIMKRNFTVNVPLKIARSKPPLTRPMNTPCKKATRNTPSWIRLSSRFDPKTGSEFVQLLTCRACCAGFWFCGVTAFRIWYKCLLRSQDRGWNKRCSRSVLL